MTPTGRIVAVAIVASAGAAAGTGYPQAAVLAGVGAAALIAALLLTVRPQVDVTCEWSRPRVSEHDDARLIVRVTGTSRHRAAPLQVTATLEGCRDLPALVTPPLAPGRVHEQVATIGGLGRGRHTVTALHAERTDPLGLVRRCIDVQTAATVLVHPRTTQLTPPGGHLGSADEGHTTDAGRRAGTVFHSLREYQAGDDHRLIHWPTTARSGTLMVRDVVAPQVQRHLVVLDTDPKLYHDGLFDQAVCIAASIALGVSRRHHTRLVCTSGTTVSCGPGRREGQVAMLDQLALVALGPSVTVRPPRDLHGVIATVVTGTQPSGAREGDRRRLDGGWGHVHGTTLVNLVQVATGPGQHGPRAERGLWVRTPGLDEFTERWNAWWRA
jgi:uncharacterized protein (DUF58 family)